MLRWYSDQLGTETGDSRRRVLYNTIWWPATETGGQAVLWSYVNII